MVGFEHREEAERFLEPLRERLRKFRPELHPEKTRLIEFGRHATERWEKRGEGKPETFQFLGFTHIFGTNYTTGSFTVQRKTIGRRMAAKLKDIGAELRRRMHGEVAGTVQWLHAAGGSWVFPISPDSGQLGKPELISRGGDATLVPSATAPKPAQPNDVGEVSGSSR